MKRIREWLYLRYFNWQIRRWQRNVIRLLQTADVSQLRQLAEKFKSMGEQGGYPELLQMAATLDANAEKIVLRRVGSKTQRIVLLIAFLLTAASGQIVSAQDQPGTVRFPTALDSPDSLFRVKNNSHSNLSISITTGSTSITVTDASSFPASGALSIDSEIIYYTTKTGNTFSGLTRGASSTTVAAHTAGVIVRSPILAVYHETLRDAIIAIETKLGSGASIDPLKIGAGTVNNTKWGYLANLSGDVQALLDAKAAASHTHAAADVVSGTLPDARIASASVWNAKENALTFNAPLSRSVNTISMVQADATHDGYLSQGDWGTFNGKQAALGFTPLNPANNLSELNSAPTARANLGLGTAATRNVAASGNAASSEVVKGDDSRLTDARTPVTHTHTASQVTDFNSSADARIAAALGVSVQAFDTDLGVIAGLAPANDDILQRKAGAWTFRTVTQYKADLALVASDISNFNSAVDARISYPVTSVFGRTGAVTLSSVDVTDALTYTPVPPTRTVNGHPLSSNVTVSKSDVGLGSVDNTSDASKPVSTATQAALDLKAPSASPVLTGTTTVAGLVITGTCTGCGGGITNSASANFIPKSIDGSGNLAASRISDVPTSGIAIDTGSSGEDVDIASVGAITIGDAADVGNSTKLIIDDVAQTFTFNKRNAAPSYKASGTGGAGYFEGVNQSSAPSTPTSAGRLFWDSSNRLSWIGTNGFIRTFDGTANTANRVYVLPDAAGTVVLDTATQTLTNKTLTSPAINSPTGISKSDVGLSNVTNTSDANKPVSTAQQAALDLKQNLLSDSAGLRSALSDESGTGAALFAGGNIGAASGTSLNTALLNPTGNLVEQRNGTSSQSFYLYKSYTDASNYSRLQFSQASNQWTITSALAGTGTASNVRLSSGSAGNLDLDGGGAINLMINTGTKWQVDGSGHFIAATDNVNDIGASGANRPRDLFLGRQIYVNATMTAGGTTGAQTINKAAGSVNFAAAAASLVVTNNLVTTTSIIICTVQTNDSTALIKNCVPASGSFTINLNAAATAETKVGFLVVNK